MVASDKLVAGLFSTPANHDQFSSQQAHVTPPNNKIYLKCTFHWSNFVGVPIVLQLTFSNGFADEWSHEILCTIDKT